MRILVINFEMDLYSSVLAWQYKVVQRLAALSEMVYVLTERIGDIDTIPNTRIERIFNCPKGNIVYDLARLLSINLHVYKLCRKNRIDCCFIHMNHLWAYRLFPCFALLRMPVLLWYAHGTVTPGLKLAHLCVSRVVTSTPESFRIRSKKVSVIGQGIDTGMFTIPEKNSDKRDIIYIGRVSRRKRIEFLVTVMAEIKKIFPQGEIRLKIIGPLITPDDLLYDRELRVQVWKLGLEGDIDFLGYIPPEFHSKFYSTVFLHINLSRTGSMDKTVLEAFSCGCPVLTTNTAFFDFLKEYPEFTIRNNGIPVIVERILKFYRNPTLYQPEQLRALVIEHHDINKYSQRIISELLSLR